MHLIARKLKGRVKSQWLFKTNLYRSLPVSGISTKCVLRRKELVTGLNDLFGTQIVFCQDMKNVKRVQWTIRLAIIIYCKDMENEQVLT